MTFGQDWGFGSSPQESNRVFEAYAEAGGNFLDTANVYTNGTSEKLVGEFVGPERSRFVIGTKYTGNQAPDDPNAGGNHRKNMVQSLELSLRRLGTDYIDLYWVHAWDEMTPVEETMSALHDLVQAGKILYVGVSDFPAWMVARANTLAELKGWAPFIALQIEYSLIERTPERELLPMAEALGLTVTPWAPLGGGVLTGKYGKKTNEQKRMDKFDYIPVSERNLRIAAEVEAVARQVDRPAAQVALAWLRGRGDTIPIIGARTRQQLTDNLGCLSLRLSDEQTRRLDEISAVDLGFPGEFLRRPMARQFVHGQTWPRIDRKGQVLVPGGPAASAAPAGAAQEAQAR
jgi:aryl-alcohol dehydrogenase-like predicted oxidoreductase